MKDNKNQNSINQYEIIGWPEIQFYMDLQGFELHSTLINQNDNMGIGSSTYLVEVEWLNTLIKLNNLLKVNNWTSDTANVC